LLAANHTEAGKRVISVAIAAMQRLIMMDVVDRSEPPNILRVLFIQACSRCMCNSQTEFRRVWAPFLDFSCCLSLIFDRIQGFNMFSRWVGGKFVVLQKDNPDEEVRIKILQTLPLLMKPAAYVATPQFICQCFEICFKMLHDKSPIIQHTSEATVRQVRLVGVFPFGFACREQCGDFDVQLVALLFERLEAVASSPGDRSDIEHGAVLLLEVRALPQCHPSAVITKVFARICAR
jgi:Dimerisation and cyclophilin-binding domain of Mon2